MLDVFAMPVHPAADVFPMLASDELAELASDIKANGLIHPIVVKDGELIDGRNRREACRIAGIKPATFELNGADPVAYILSSNINRRHMTKGQRAMAVAMIYPEGKPGERTDLHSATSSKIEEVGAGYISMARTVLKWAPELASQVLAGAAVLDKAYSIATDRKTAEEVPQKRLDALRAQDPDLADKVVEQALSLDNAEGASKDRRSRERAARQGTYDALAALERYLFMFREPSHRGEFIKILREHPNEINKEDVLKSLNEWQDAINTTVGEINEG
jgi:hypothetical protein